MCGTRSELYRGVRVRRSGYEIGCCEGGQDEVAKNAPTMSCACRCSLAALPQCFFFHHTYLGSNRQLGQDGGQYTATSLEDTGWTQTQLNHVALYAWCSVLAGVCTQSVG